MEVPSWVSPERNFAAGKGLAISSLKLSTPLIMSKVLNGIHLVLTIRHLHQVMGRGIALHSRQFGKDLFIFAIPGAEPSNLWHKILAEHNMSMAAAILHLTRGPVYL